MNMNTVSSQLAKYTTMPLTTLTFLAITILLSAVTSYVRTQSYGSMVGDNPQLEFDEVIIPAFQLVPSHIIFHPWTLWVAAFVETSPFQFIAGLAIIYFGITFLESQWNPKSLADDSGDDLSNYLISQPVSETLTFVSVVIVVSNFFCLLVVTLVNLINSTAENLNQPLQYGLFILVLPLAVVAKQLTPETNTRLITFKFRLKRLPFILLSASLLLSVVKRSLSPFLPSFVSFFTAWYYLRYVQISPAINTEILPTSTAASSRQAASSVRGDPSDTFSLVEFFPEVLKPTLKPLFEGFYQLSVLLGVVRAWNDDDVDIGNLRSNMRVAGTSSKSLQPEQSSTSNPEIDERRRQIALKVLEETVKTSK